MQSASARTDADADAGRFGLLACALAGREVTIEAAAPGEPPWTDGARIFLDPALPTEERLHATAVQACLIAAGSLDPEIMRRLGRRPGPARRYLAVEGLRALDANRGLLPSVLHPMLEAAVVRSGSPADSLYLAHGREEIAYAPAYFGVLQPRKVLVAARPAAVDAGHRPRRDVGSEFRDLDDEDESEDLAASFTSPVNTRSPIGRLLQRLLRSSRRSGGGGNPGSETATHRSRGAGRDGIRSTAGAVPDGGGNSGGRRGWTYPEWDSANRRYRPHWCTVQEREAEAGDMPLAVPERHSLRRPLTRLGIALDRAHRQPLGDDIDIDAVVQARVEIAAGRPADERFYIDTQPRRRDLAVLILLDISGSAAKAGTLGQTVHEQQRMAAAMLAVALHELGDRVALYAYHSHGRASVDLLGVKRFDEPLDHSTLRRLSALRPGAYSRLGAAIRHGTAIIGNRGATSHRLLVVVSDGLAYDHGYERAHGAADARRALSEARREGIGCLCLTVGAATDGDALSRVFGSAAHAAVARPAQLGDIIGPLFRSALRSADTRRKVA